MRLNTKYIIRAQEWWSFILPPILFCFYASLLQDHTAGVHILFQATMLMTTAVITALTGYFINDWSDMEDDQKAGKYNYVAHFPTWIKYGFLPIMVLLFLLLWLIGKILFHSPYLHLYLFVGGGNILLFILYSIPPFRLKKNAYIAPFLDATYSGTLFYGLAFWVGSSANFQPKGPFILLLFWGVLKGLRNYLSHLSDDIENDRKAGLNTLATIYSAQSIQKIANYLFPFEMIVLISFFYLLPIIPVVGLLLCSLFLLQWLVSIPKAASIKYSSLNDLHEIWLPLAIMAQLIYSDNWYITLLLFHFIFFPQHLTKCFFTLKNGIFKLFKKKPISLKELLNGKK